ncbi:MAG: transglycosylase SLT domain-containing protein [Chitinispirillales bacterium]|jgi:membrane-bound lytic murein transglycosylase D|nr:transglycosylase SLT domain-containing protein [Chitinispirillales bacterium]
MQKIIKQRHYLTCFLFGVFALVAGCASSAKGVHVDLQVPYEPEAVVFVDDYETTDAEESAYEYESVEEPEPEPEVSIDELLQFARELSGDSLFSDADSVLRRASALIKRNSEHAEDERFPWRDHIDDVISIYADLAPSGFSLPDEIFTLIFKSDLLEMQLDTLKLSPRDSAFFERLSRKRGVVYDVPMVWNNRVKRALLALTRTRANAFDRWLNRAGYYYPVMAQMFADAGLPQDLAYLPIIESVFNPAATSPARAAGIWQFIPSTGRSFGLRQNYWIDERRDPLKSTEAAINFLSQLYGNFGDWHIALAAYNCGGGCVGRAIRRADGLRDYWQLQLPRETMNYVPLYLASVIIAKNPDVFEFAIQDTLVFDLDTVYVHDCLEMRVIAEGIDIPLDTLKLMNPHILHGFTPPDMQNMILYLPNGYADKFREFYENLPDSAKTKFYSYVVQRGDNLQQIARNFRVKADAIRETNQMRSNDVTVGNRLIIPIPADGTLPQPMARLVNLSDSDLRATRNRRTTPPGRPLGDTAVHRGRYTVQRGDTLYGISRQIGVPVNELARINGLDARRPRIFPGDVIVYTPR